MGFVAGLLASSLQKAAETIIGYAADASAGYLARETLNNIVEECAEKGGKFAGDFGRKAGTAAGKILAGNTLPAIQEEKQAFAGAIRSVGTLALDAGKNKNQDTWADTAWKTAQVGAIIGGTVAGAAGIVPVAGVALGAAVIGAAPKVIDAFREEIKPEDRPDLVDNVIIPGVKQVLFTAAGTAVGNYVRYETVEAAYRDRIEQFGDAAKAIRSYLPGWAASPVETIARAAGKIDAGRYAMSDEMISNANSAGSLAQNAVQTGLEVGNAVFSGRKKGKTWFDTARQVSWLGAGALGTAALVVLAPEAAAVAGGLAAIGVANEGVRWVRGQFLESEKPVKVSVPVTEPDPKPVTELEKAVAELKPQALVNEEPELVHIAVTA